jgi:acylphosphatase
VNRGIKVAYRLTITGLVHGVAFRASLSEVARHHNVSGWVRNVVDGSVEAFLEGKEEDVRAVLEWAERGPPRARVDSVRAEKASPHNIRGFMVTG